MLWIALHLPLLSLESFATTLSEEDAGAQALALMDAHTIQSANSVARALGVKPGIKRATALALAPRLVLGQADAARDAEALRTVAHAALAFTPSVSIQPPSEAASVDHAPSHTVLLEVQASLRYFGGLPSLSKRLDESLAPFGHRVHAVSASTPLGAALLARVHRRLDCADLAATKRALADAPVWLLGPGREHWDALQGMGLQTLADLAGVPRDGLARRFGETVLSELDRAMGRRPDPRLPLALPPAFDSRLELFARVDTGEQLMHGATILLARLLAWLSAQHAFVRRFRLRMHHEKRLRRDDSPADVTELDVALAEPSRDLAHLGVLLRERLAQIRLPAPTLELSLHADDIARRAPPNAELFATPASEQEGLTRLIERLQARLGADQVKHLVPHQDHRPECTGTWRPAEAQRRPPRARSATLTRPDPAPPALPPAVPTAMRPVWLLPKPEPLGERHHGPLLDGQALQLLSGPERIEAGWWDGAVAERDYFIAQSPGGALVWIYRARLPKEGADQGWFLQGRFG